MGYRDELKALQEKLEDAEHENRELKASYLSNADLGAELKALRSRLDRERDHLKVLEAQLPSNRRWGSTFGFTVIALCLIPIGIGKFWHWFGDVRNQRRPPAVRQEAPPSVPPRRLFEQEVQERADELASCVPVGENVEVFAELVINAEGRPIQILNERVSGEPLRDASQRCVNQSLYRIRLAPASSTMRFTTTLRWRDGSFAVLSPTPTSDAAGNTLGT